MRRVGYGLGIVLVLVGIFWSGRESTHGFGAFWEHWWCPLPVAAILLGLATAFVVARTSSQAT